MKTACPCCGSTVESDFPIVDLGSNTIAWAGKSFRTAPKRAEILFTLLSKPMTFVTKEHLIAKVWGYGDIEAIDVAGSLSAHIAQLRKELTPIGFAIDVSYNRGWKLAKHSENLSGSLSRAGKGGRPKRVAP